MNRGRRPSERSAGTIDRTLRELSGDAPSVYSPGMYLILRAAADPGHGEAPEWDAIPALHVAHFHARSSQHRPAVEARLAHADRVIHVRFQVDDRFVRCIHTDYESDTYKDSCVELFLQPQGREGYFALEVNCGGAFSLRYIEDPRRTPNRFAKWTAVSAQDAGRLRIGHSMPARVEPEVEGPVRWWVTVAWPVDTMEPYCGPIGDLRGQRWRGNAFKCGDETSHPHWASWWPIGDALNFHQPSYFGPLVFA